MHLRYFNRLLFKQNLLYEVIKYKLIYIFKILVEKCLTSNNHYILLKDFTLYNIRTHLKFDLYLQSTNVKTFLCQERDFVNSKIDL